MLFQEVPTGCLTQGNWVGKLVLFDAMQRDLQVEECWPSWAFDLSRFGCCFGPEKTLKKNGHAALLLNCPSHIEAPGTRENWDNCRTSQGALRKKDLQIHGKLAPHQIHLVILVILDSYQRLLVKGFDSKPHKVEPGVEAENGLPG